METITLITGANKGLGRETARRLLEIGHTVVVTARDTRRGQPVADELGAAFVAMDVTDDASVAAAAERIAENYGRLDVLINNAGVAGPRKPLADITVEDARDVLDTNVLSVVRTTHGFLPLLRLASNPRIVNVSSGTGRISWQVTQGFPQEVSPPLYAASKSALTMLTLQYAHALPGMLVNAAWPGYTVTDINEGQGTQTVTEGSEAIVALATLPPDGPTGTCRQRNGAADPW